jgi:hypothetical protein
VPAGALRPGDELLSHDGRWLPVREVADGRRVATVYNLEMEGEHTYFVGSPEWGFDLWAHNAECSASGKYTKPKLPPKQVVKRDGVTVKHYFRGNDHAPPHLHVVGGGPPVKIGANGKPLDSKVKLSPTQQKVVDESLPEIRSATNKIRRWLKFKIHFKDK